MPRIAAADAEWVATSFNEAVIQAALYGLYACIVFMSVWILVRKGVRHSCPRTGLLITTIALFALSTTYVVLFIKCFQIQFPTLTSDSTPDNPDWLKKETAYLSNVLLVLRRVSYLISDMVVVWRTWCIWPESAWIRLYLAVVLLATIGTSIATAIMNIQGALSLLDSNMLGTFCLLLTNFSTTMLCAYKFWLYRQFIRLNYGHGRKRKALVDSMLGLMVESGAVYCVFWLLLMLGDFGKTWDGPYELELLMPHFSGIYVSLIVLVVALPQTSSESFFLGVDRDIEYEDPRRHKLETIEFAVPKSASSSNVAPTTSGLLKEDLEEYRV